MLRRAQRHWGLLKALSRADIRSAISHAWRSSYSGDWGEIREHLLGTMRAKEWSASMRLGQLRQELELAQKYKHRSCFSDAAQCYLNALRLFPRSRAREELRAFGYRPAEINQAQKTGILPRATEPQNFGPTDLASKR